MRLTCLKLHLSLKGAINLGGGRLQSQVPSVPLEKGSQETSETQEAPSIIKSLRTKVMLSVRMTHV